MKNCSHFKIVLVVYIVVVQYCGVIIFGYQQQLDLEEGKYYTVHIVCK